MKCGVLERYGAQRGCYRELGELRVIKKKCYGFYALFIHLTMIPIRQKVHLIRFKGYSEHSVLVICCMASVGTLIAPARVHYAAILVAGRTEKSYHSQPKELGENIQGSKGD